MEEEEAARKALAGLSELLQKKQAEQQGRLPEESRASQRPLRVLTPGEQLCDEFRRHDEFFRRNSNRGAKFTVEIRGRKKVG